MIRSHHTAVVAIAKDEDPYLVEWAAYHLAIGFDHIFLYDNGSRVRPRSLLRSRLARARITVIDWPDSPDQNTQFTAYAHFLKTHGRRVDWAAVIDLDEFICLKAHGSIREFLAGFEGADGIALNWRFFGSSGQTEHRPGLLMERFTRAAEIANSVNGGVKTISRPRAVALLTPHFCAYRGAPRVRSASGEPAANEWRIDIDPANFAVAQVNHYFVKSRAEWAAKLRRGYGWTDEDRAPLFAMCDRNECEDSAILRWAPETRRWMVRLATSDRDRLRRALARVARGLRGGAVRGR